jgi:hypothetical protein
MGLENQGARNPTLTRWAKKMSPLTGLKCPKTEESDTIGKMRNMAHSGSLMRALTLEQLVELTGNDARRHASDVRSQWR